MRGEGKGRLVVMEGIDGCGKTVQTDLLVARLRSLGKAVRMDDYPHYESSFWGGHVGRMLRGDFGDPMQVSPYLTALPYMLDQAEGSKQIREWLDNGEWVVSNRFFTSNVHQIAKMPQERRGEFSRWLWEAGYGQMGIARPDLVVVLLVDPPVCRENILKKARRQYTGGELMDKAEKDFGHQMEAAGEYRRMVAENHQWWVQVECCREGRLLEPEEIHEMVFGEVGRRLAA